jgi:hypothetical protein
MIYADFKDRRERERDREREREKENIIITVYTPRPSGAQCMQEI